MHFCVQVLLRHHVRLKFASSPWRSDCAEFAPGSVCAELTFSSWGDCTAAHLILVGPHLLFWGICSYDLDQWRGFPDRSFSLFYGSCTCDLRPSVIADISWLAELLRDSVVSLCIKLIECSKRKGSIVDCFPLVGICFSSIIFSLGPTVYILNFLPQVL